MTLRKSILVVLFSLSFASCGDSDDELDASVQDASDSALGDTSATDDSTTPDAFVPDSGPDAPPPASCAAGDFVGDVEWSGRLVVEEGTTLCAYMRDRGGSDALAIPRILRDKSIITATPGTYPMPASDQEQAFLIPMCRRQLSGSCPRDDGGRSPRTTRYVHRNARE